ncbi:MAG: carboxymuconolactone decarboxylase family protein [Deinococcales bacterium]|jgi:4-carboxymuconolactone decarboxylase
MSLPKPYERLKQRYPDVVRAYETLGQAATDAGPLSEREQRLVKFALAVGAAHEGALHSHARRALKAGVTADELRHAVLQATTTLGFPSMMRAMTWLEDVLDEKG